jgi:hypothetical protein
LVEQGILAKVPRTFKAAPEQQAGPAVASEMPGAADEVEAAEDAKAQPAPEPETAAEPEPEPATEPAAPDAAEAEPTP